MKRANTGMRQIDIKGMANTNLCLLAKKRKLYEYNSILHQVPLESGLLYKETEHFNSLIDKKQKLEFIRTFAVLVITS